MIARTADAAGIEFSLQQLVDRLDDRVTAEKLQEQIRYLLGTGMPNLSPLLPFMLSLKGKPYTLERHYPFEPFFNTFTPRKILLKTGRQVGKSSNLAAQGVVSTVTIPFFNTLYVTPLYEMIRRFSHNYVRGFVEQSPIRRLFVKSTSSQNVLQRSFLNNSTMHFSFAFHDADRTRGLNCDRVGFDEIQDMDETFIPIIRETMSGSEQWGIEQYAGTPKTLDNTIENLWQRSSQGEWCIPCSHCRYLNVPCMSHDLVDMLGPWHPDVSETHPGTICAKCGKPIFPPDGFWVHKHPDRLAEFSGYHLPQLALPMHYGNPDKWAILKGKQEGAYNTAVNVFFNEVCGESYDVGSKLITQTDLENAAKLHPNDENIARQKIGQYDLRMLGIDWGGGGEKEVSFTTYAVLGWKPDGSGIDVIYGFRSLTPHDHIREARIAIDIVRKFQCHVIAHDYNGAGQYREKYIVDAGWPIEKLAPIAYVRAATQGMFRHIQATEIHPRSHYRLDKSRSLVLTCHQIKNGRLNFFEYDNKGEDDRGLLHDFLALVEEKADSRSGSDTYTIVRAQNQTDDFAHAVNYGACAMWHIRGAWPNVAEIDRYMPSADFIKAASPGAGQIDWDDV